MTVSKLAEIELVAQAWAREYTRTTGRPGFYSIHETEGSIRTSGEPFPTRTALDSSYWASADALAEGVKRLRCRPSFGSKAPDHVAELQEALEIATQDYKAAAARVAELELELEGLR